MEEVSEGVGVADNDDGADDSSAMVVIFDTKRSWERRFLGRDLYGRELSSTTDLLDPIGIPSTLLRKRFPSSIFSYFIELEQRSKNENRKKSLGRSWIL